MKVLYDYQIFQMQRFGGISRYFHELINSSQKLGLYDSKLSMAVSSNEYLRDAEHGPYFLNSKYQAKSYRFTNLINRLISERDVSKGKFDVLHPTFYETYFLQKIHRPFVLTVYDLINEKYPSFFQNNEAFIERKRILMQKASRIIAISENTKQDIIEYFKIPEEKISVTYLAESLTGLTSSQVSKLPDRYVLFVGNRGGYKNFSTFYESVKHLFRAGESFTVVCAGGGSFTAQEVALFEKDGISDRFVQVSFKTNEELKYIYEKALCFVFPSLYEGFGIPILESFAAGCPVCASYSSSFKEIGGNAIVFFDPDSVSSMSDSIKKALAVGRGSYLTQNAALELQKYSWDNTCRETFNVYLKC